MKKLTKILSLVLACALCVGLLAACGKTETPAASSAAASTSTEATGAFKIGFSGPLTGGAAIYGTAAKNGATIAAEEITRAFCDGDDAGYGNLHPKLIWGRTKTIGRGGDRCDFLLEYKKEESSKKATEFLQ